MTPFNGVRAAFWLIAFVIGVQAIIVLIGVVMCATYSAEIVAGKFQCDREGRLAELLTAALAAALAFAGGAARSP